jgi:hypothetical protein
MTIFHPPSYCGTCGELTASTGQRNWCSHCGSVLDTAELLGPVANIAGTSAGPPVGGWGGDPIGTPKRPLEPVKVASSGRKPRGTHARPHMLDVYRAYRGD